MPADPEVLLGLGALGDSLERLVAAVEPSQVVGGWATVELDRAEAEVVGRLAAIDLHDPQIARAPADPLLGARCRALRYAAGRTMLLLEPASEGRLAAALARHGEGSVVRYLLADEDAPARARAAGFRLTTERPGPLGRQRVVLGGPRWGPFLVLVSDGGAAPTPG